MPSLLVASGIEKSYRRGVWPLRRDHQVLRGVDLERYAATRAAHLSGGTLAKLNLALALLADPAVLLLDEPYDGFDFDTYLKFWDLVARRRVTGRS